MKPVAMSPKPAPEEPRLCYQSSTETSIKTSDLIEQALDSKVTLTTRELLPMSLEIWRHVKDLATSEKVSANILEEDPVDSYLSTFFKEDPVDSYLNTFFKEDLVVHSLKKIQHPPAMMPRDTALPPPLNPPPPMYFPLVSPTTYILDSPI